MQKPTWEGAKCTSPPLIQPGVEHQGVKVSVSLPDADVEYLDTYARTQGLDSRSAAVQKTVRLLRASELGAAYEDAWTDRAADEDAELWDAAAADGLS